nr:MAG TPA: hypothetical protein [Caudoviricetes sp.]
MVYATINAIIEIIVGIQGCRSGNGFHSSSLFIFFTSLFYWLLLLSPLSCNYRLRQSRV